MSMPPAIANTFLFEMMKSKSKDVTLAAIYALGEGRCQAENITRELGVRLENGKYPTLRLFSIQ
ncbi:hypothetical protein NW470_004184 [Salmonella enterica]|nr:hypothetical protein [Salmonella enterica]